MTEESLFHQALGQPAERRAAFLERACAGDEALRRRLEALLHAHDHPASFLAEPAANPAAIIALPPQPEVEAAAERPGGEDAGSRIGPYKLLQRIGEGGMGAVWMADQTEPVQRKVALKIIKPGLDSDHVLARFEAERQALALMDHPHIARVLDAGTTGSGRPFFVMELVKGVPLTKFCDERRLTPRQRLELFIPVCQAVQHAHQKGVIHRDIKPSNVLIALYDGQPVPKVIDFGVAKAMGPKLTERTLFTEFGQVVGTLEYMSPEQAQLNNLDIDTRSDVYALGVLLYELLTGTTPLQRETLKEVPLLEVLRAIREDDPPTPSNRLSTTRELASIAANRGLEPRKLSGLVRGELDWIVMKALEKDRNRRYETAASLARDIERYLADEPVQACPPSAAYRLRKFARRHRATLTFAGLLLLFLLLLGGGLGWVVGDRVARRQAQAKEADNALGQAARCLEQGQWPEATAWAQRADGVLAGAEGHPALRQRLQDIRGDLDLVADVQEIRIRQAQVRDEHFDNLAADPEFAQAFQKYGIWVEGLGVEEAAAAVRARPIRLELVLALDDWAAVRRGRGGSDRRHLLAVAEAADTDDLRNEFRRALMQQPVDRSALERLAASDGLGKLPAPTLVLLGRSLRAAGALQQAAAVLLQAQQRYPNDFWANHELGSCLGAARPPHWAEALPFFTAAVGLRPESPGARVNLGNALDHLGDRNGAVAAFREAIRLKPDYAAPYSGRGNAYRELRQFDRALSDCSRALELKPDLVEAWYNRGNVYRDLGQQEKAVADYTRALELRPTYALARNNRGLSYYLLGQLDKAVADCTQALEADPDFAEAWCNRGNAYNDLGQRDKAVADYTKAIELKPDYASAWYNRGNAYRLLGEREKAIADYTRAVELKPDYAIAWCNRGIVYDSLGQREKAVADYTKATELRPDDAKTWCNRGLAYDSLGQWEKAVADYTKAIELQPDYAKAWCNRGNAYHALGQRDKAVADYTKAIELKPDLAEAWHNRGNTYHRAGELDKAIADYDKALELKPDYVEAWNNRGLAYWHKGQPARAVADYTRALEVKPDHVKAWNNRGVAYRALGQPDRAVADCTRALELRPDYVNAWSNRGEAYGALGRWGKAISDFAKASDLAPASPAALNQLAWLLAACPEAKFRDPGRAVEAAKKAVALAPEGGGYWNTLGVAHYRAGDWKAAVAALQKSVELRHGGDGFDFLFLAMAQWQAGNRADARTWYDRAVHWLGEQREALAKDARQAEELRRFRAEAEELLQVGAGKD
jgi:tetratricopeptide (TPR) repeat protein